LSAALGAYSAPQTPYLYLGGLLLNGGDREERKGRGGGEKKGREGSGARRLP